MQLTGTPIYTFQVHQTAPQFTPQLTLHLWLSQYRSCINSDVATRMVLIVLRLYIMHNGLLAINNWCNIESITHFSQTQFTISL